MNFKVLDA